MMPIRDRSEIQTLTARAPAKLIISGEHSVLYGQPALALAVDCYTTTTTTWRDTPHIHFKLLDLAYSKSHTSIALRNLAKDLRHNYSGFLHGKSSIGSVLKRPFELLQYSVSNLLDYLNVQLPRGLEIAVDSNIPIGCGMGSSAAALLSTVYALTNFLNFKWPRDDYVTFTREMENLQHGKSSGLDLHLATYGGYARFKDGVAQVLAVPNIKLQIVNTGKPSSTTGECVSAVAASFVNDPNLAIKFGNITNNIEQAISENNLEALKQGIKDNHRLLKHIGVVPNRVAKFIEEIEASGGAAKICGAGAVTGDNAGVVLLVSDIDMQDIVDKYGYKLQNVQVDLYGTQIL
jgi:mevalonate kinase